MSIITLQVLKVDDLRTPVGIFGDKAVALIGNRTIISGSTPKKLVNLSGSECLFYF